MTHSFGRLRLVCAVLLVTLSITAGYALRYDRSPHCGVLSVAAQASPSSANTTVTNSLTVTPGTLSLGSTLQATGKATAGEKPLANAVVSLHMGDVKLANTQTNANGEYSFNEPVGLYYLAAALNNGATIYTVAESRDAAFVSTPSAVTTVSVDQLPLYLLIFIITAAILLGLYLYVRRMSGKALLGSLRMRWAKPAVEGQAPETEPTASEVRDLVQEQPVADVTPKEALDPAVPAEIAAPLVDETQREGVTEPPEPEVPESAANTGVLKQAHDFFEHGNDRQAVNMLYDATLLDIATTHKVTIASHATHWETFYAIEAAVPEVQAPLRTLTVVYELVNYAGKALTEEQRNAAVDAFGAIKEHLERANA